MKRERRNLDGKTDEERHPDYVLEAPTQVIERPHRYHLGAVLVRLRHHDPHIEGMRISAEVKREDRQQHQHAAEQGIEKEFDRGIFTPGSAPDADEKIHRQQHHFPKNIKEEKVESAENAHHASIEQKKEREITFHALLDAERSKDAEKAQQRGQKYHGNTQAIDAHGVADVVCRNPGVIFDELKSGNRAIEILEQPDRHQQRRHGRDCRYPTNQLGVVGQREHDCRSGNRYESHVSKDVIHRFHSPWRSARVTQLGDNQQHHGDQDSVQIAVDVARLNSAKLVADREGQIGDQVDDTVDHVLIEQTIEPSNKPGQSG